MLVYAYRLVKGDRISGTVAAVADVKDRMSDEVTVEFENGHSKTFRGNAFLNVSHRTPTARPKYKPEHR